VIGDKVVVRGSAPSYYLKQLALRGVLDVLGSTGAACIELNVEVDNGPARASETDAPDNMTFRDP
jgi:hypothetical protein